MEFVKNSHDKILKKIYAEIQTDIKERLHSFSEIWKNATDEELFHELVFCLFTPQSKAKSCWQAVEFLIKSNLILNGSEKEIAQNIRGVRFRNNKARYLVLARTRFIDSNESIRQSLEKHQSDEEKRLWLLQNIKGLGMKEASHFLRNIGFFEKLTILDRHILKNLNKSDVISEIPKTISYKKYIDIETKMQNYSQKLQIPLPYLDIVMWFKETQEIFK